MVAACTVTTGPRQSGPTATSALIPSYVATSDGSRLTIDASLYWSSVDTVELSDGDHFEVTVAARPLPLSKQSGNVYEGTMPAPAQETSVLVAFRRAAGKVDAPSSAVTLPAPFTIDSSVPGSWSATSELALRTTGLSVNEIEVKVEGACLVDGEQTLPVIVSGDGSVVVEGSKLHFTGDAPDCDVTATLRLSTKGTVDEALGVSSFDEGRGIFAVQERKVFAHVAP